MTKIGFATSGKRCFSTGPTVPKICGNWSNSWIAYSGRRTCAQPRRPLRHHTGILTQTSRFTDLYAACKAVWYRGRWSWNTSMMLTCQFVMHRQPQNGVSGVVAMNTRDHARIVYGVGSIEVKLGMRERGGRLPKDSCDVHG
ncbi:hypothetical protein TraAM80_04158 [Trypanosoma rangeli]|uniref:Uncharacterized protein n=1 Tax=Trypanosoma rangeli TaxID=5698 RepID=A0A422NKX6_TRYRA|nr:uncharacterized protein TraAM80_04158 [Trypanosoma rangeli]RNF06074.1 hypothetical protein TraAM80_04158 [Trypanosoma rangeli]|eukprot:RNF06074.1 hypothetical protein TraAM80_04158 [Trypanosoma rangeli]